jgi:ClpP class serine protease
MYSIYGLESNYLQQFINFQNNVEKIKNEMSIEVVEKIKFETLDRITDPESKYKTNENGVAIILIKGQLRETPEVCASLFGAEQTLYSDIIESINHADENINVNKIILDIDSPGGTVSGLDLAAMAIRNTKTPIHAYIHNLGASAAYWLASQADTITAVSPTSEIGSIGVAAEIIDRSKQDENRGIKRYILTSDDAPEKRPNIATKKGRDMIVERLNDIHNVFVKRISEGRMISIEIINKDFGRGNVLIAEKALKVGMIDKIINNKTF